VGGAEAVERRRQGGGAPDRDGARVLGRVEVDVAEREVRLGRPRTILREELWILDAIDAAREPLHLVGDVVLVPVVVGEGEAEVADGLRAELRARVAVPPLLL